MNSFLRSITFRGERLLCSGLCGVAAISISTAVHFQYTSLPSTPDFEVSREVVLEALPDPVVSEFLADGKKFSKAGKSVAIDRSVSDFDPPRTSNRPSQAAFDRLFGTRSISISNSVVMQRWKSVLNEAADSSILNACEFSDSEFCLLPRVVAMRSEIARLRDRPRELQVRAVNEFVNRHIRYASDIAVYGQPDHWATLRELLQRGQGDCEDFAIAKMWMLTALGVPAHTIRMVVLRDIASRQDHAVLAVQGENAIWILDNRFSLVRNDYEIRNYQPYYSLSAAGLSWVHSLPGPSEHPVTASVSGPVASVRAN